MKFVGRRNVGGENRFGMNGFEKKGGVEDEDGMFGGMRERR